MRVVIFMDEGNIQRVVSDEKLDVTIIDQDVEYCDLDGLKEILGKEAYVYTGITESDVDPDLVSRVEEDKKS
ncbi:hypothetical protein [Bacillus subtilis]|uniref:hypothetical protein n=1 Tax=Bacillus subtilis TaxID=1423 RepID=UPI002025BCB1|nr:hypothetical protein [Bacillus subtilis]MCL9628351.1 hypothetical protein [Bacillus subtilis]